jgi:hypothetical protein
VPQVLNLADGIAELVETDVEMPLLLFEFFLLLVEQPDIVVDAGVISMARFSERRAPLTNRGNASG